VWGEDSGYITKVESLAEAFGRNIREERKGYFPKDLKYVGHHGKRGGGKEDLKTIS